MIRAVRPACRYTRILTADWEVVGPGGMKITWKTTSVAIVIENAEHDFVEPFKRRSNIMKF
jgi:hypothetical protein